MSNTYRARRVAASRTSTVAAHGAVARFARDHGLSRQAVYNGLEARRFVVDERTREIVALPHIVPAVAKPVAALAADDLNFQRALIRRTVITYIASAIVEGKTAEDAVYGVVSDIRALAHDAGWSAP